MSETMTDRTEIARGVLSWPRTERIGDRYGCIRLFADPACERYGPLTEGSGRGKLVAEVLEARQSEHIGDLFHGFFPETPAVGERIELGEGTLFYEDVDRYGRCVGLRPDDGRQTFWLTPQMLYRAHSQTVILWFEPSQ